MSGSSSSSSAPPPRPLLFQVSLPPIYLSVSVYLVYTSLPPLSPSIFHRSRLTSVSPPSPSLCRPLSSSDLPRLAFVDLPPVCLAFSDPVSPLSHLLRPYLLCLPLFAFDHSTSNFSPQVHLKSDLSKSLSRPSLRPPPSTSPMHLKSSNHPFLPSTPLLEYHSL